MGREGVLVEMTFELGQPREEAARATQAVKTA